MIEINKVTKKYGSRPAVKDLCFSVEKGEVVGFLGPNGAGKTTTMKIITGCMSATSGEVKIAGEDIFENPLSTKQKIGYLPELPPVYGDMYVEHYLRYVAGLKRYPVKGGVSVRALIDEVMEKTGLQSVRRRLIQNLSKGYKQRTGLAQALIGNPEILVLDEPTAGLDPNQVLEIRNLIAQLKGKHTIILSTHILSEVQVTCDRVIIIKEGELVTQESLSALREKQSLSRRTISVRVKNLSEELTTKLKALSGVEEVSVDQSSGVLALLVAAGTSRDLNELTAKTVMEKGAGLIELNESFSLEDVFLKLTSEGSGGSNPKAQNTGGEKTYR